MTDIQGHNVTPTTGRVIPVGQSGARRAEKAGATDAPAAHPGAHDVRRALLAAVSARAASVQRGALAARTAIDALSRVDEAVTFALDAAAEATTTGALPDEAIDLLQWQVDTAVNAVDSLCGGATCGGERLFDGRFIVRGGGMDFTLPEVSSRSLGGAARAEIQMWGGRVEYSQSIASAGSGGPNSLSFFARGAAQALSAGLARVREIREAVSGFYDESVMPGLSDVAVALANSLASETRPQDVTQVARLLEEMRGNLAAACEAGSSRQPGAVLKLLQ